MHDVAPASATVSLDGHTWAATAQSWDKLSPVDVRVVLAREVDPNDCAASRSPQVEISLLIGDRTVPHVIEPLDVETPNSGRVFYSDEDEDYILAVSGHVTPGLTNWMYSESEGHNVVAQIDGDFDVVLSDGRSLMGAFSAKPCGPQ